MKLIITSLLFLFTSICFGQNVADTTVYFDNDSLVIYRGKASQEVKFKNEEPLGVFLNHYTPESVKEYVVKNKIKGKIYISFIVDSTGTPRNVNFYKGIDDYFLKSYYIKVIYLT